MIKNWPEHKLYFFFLIVIALSLTYSKVLLSIGLIAIAVNWIVGGNFSAKWALLYNHKKSMLILSSFMIVYVLSLLYSNNFWFGLEKIRIILPLFTLPIIIGSSPILSKKQTNLLLYLFVAAVVITSVVGYLNYYQIIDYPAKMKNPFLPFVEAARFGLMINLAIGFLLLKFILSSSRGVERVISPVIIAWLVYFLILIKSLTSVITLFVLLSFIIYIYFSYKHKIKGRIFAIFSILVFIAITSGYVYSVYRFFYDTEPINTQTIEKFTANGNIYSHNFDNKDIENSEYVFLYVCDKELITEWNKRSKKHVEEDSIELKNTIYSYLTSKGHRKDSVGISLLTDKDIVAIENGKSNYLYTLPFSPYAIVYNVIWEIDKYQRYHTANGQSKMQRWVYLNVAMDVIKENPLLGVGIGDLQLAFNKQYVDAHIPLEKQFWLRAHNQYVTFVIAFGLIGFCCILFCIFYPIFKEHGFRNYLFTLFFIIGFLSMFTEDTLETHVGASFFAFFYILLLVGIPKFKFNEVNR